MRSFAGTKSIYMTAKTEEKEAPKTDITKLTLKEKIARITGELDPINKTKRPHDTVSFKYRSIDDVMNALNPFLSTYQLTLQCKVFKSELTSRTFTKNNVEKIAYTAVVGITYIISDQSGETESWDEVNMSEDYADKAITQASSMCYKYFFLRKFCIPTEDMPDGDSRQPEYRSNEHDEERSGPRPTKWLDEGTPEWDAMVERINTGEPAAQVLADIKTKFKTNKRQDEAIAQLKPAPKQQQPAQQQPKVDQKPAAGAKKKMLLNANTKAEWEKLKEAGSAFKKEEVPEGARLYNNNVKKLTAKEITMDTIKGVFDLDEVVTQHYNSL